MSARAPLPSGCPMTIDWLDVMTLPTSFPVLWSDTSEEVADLLTKASVHFVEMSEPRPILTAEEARQLAEDDDWLGLK